MHTKSKHDDSKAIFRPLSYYFLLIDHVRRASARPICLLAVIHLGSCCLDSFMKPQEPDHVLAQNQNAAVRVTPSGVTSSQPTTTAPMSADPPPYVSEGGHVGKGKG